VSPAPGGHKSSAFSPAAAPRAVPIAAVLPEGAGLQRVLNPHGERQSAGCVPRRARSFSLPAYAALRRGHFLVLASCVSLGLKGAAVARSGRPATLRRLYQARHFSPPSHRTREELKSESAGSEIVLAMPVSPACDFWLNDVAAP